MQDIIILVIEITLPAILGYIVYLLKEQKKERRAADKGIMLLLRVKLIDYHKEWTTRGSITKNGIQNFLEMYDVYHSLGGNGMVTHLKEEIEQLSIRD